MCRDCRGLGMYGFMLFMKEIWESMNIFQFSWSSYAKYHDMLSRDDEHANLCCFEARNHAICCCCCVEHIIWWNLDIFVAMKILTCCSCWDKHENVLGCMINGVEKKLAHKVKDNERLASMKLCFWDVWPLQVFEDFCSEIHDIFCVILLLESREIC